jgi:hypothetical protein
MRRYEGRWVVHVPGHDRDLLDDFGNALEAELCEPDEQERLRRPEDQAAGARGDFAGAVRKPYILDEIENIP